MNPINIAFRLLLTSLLLCSSFLLMARAQTPTPSPSPSQQATKPDDKQAKEEIRSLLNQHRRYRRA
jgi:hypothetical protein